MPKKTQSTTSGASGNGLFPISDVTGSRGLVSLQRDKDGNKSKGKGDTRTKDPYIPISVVTGSRDITTVSPQLRAFLLKGSPSATTAMPEEYAGLTNVLEKAADVINFDEWGDLTAKQQLAVAQKAGLSLEDQRELLNTKPHYVETIAKVQDIFANRYALGITLADARNTAKELFDIANERNEAITKTGKYENDVVFAPRALRWLDEEEKKLLDNPPKKASETEWDTEYTGGNPQQTSMDDTSGSTQNGSANDYIQVPGKALIGPGSNNPTINCYGYVLMNLGIQPSDGDYDIQPGMLSETRAGDHAHVVGNEIVLNNDLETIKDFVIRDFKQTGRTAREIDSYKNANEGEIVVALKTTHPFIGMEDYHCMVLLSDGTWADKLGTGGNSRNREIEDPDKSWGDWW
ncbi:MAG: hypothetical protein Q8S22_04165, partial [Eubacteriales bacterium]|nr:hypothetical protein [Eubacteriales bacterium]